MSVGDGHVGVFDRVIARTVPLVPQPVVRRLAAPYVAGATLDDALRVVRRLAHDALGATLDMLGENVTREDLAEETTQTYLHTLDALAAHGPTAEVSLKPSGFGSRLGWDVAGGRIERVVAHADSLGLSACIDMEDSLTTDGTLELYRRLRRSHGRLAVAMQARLWRTASDLEALADLQPNVRLCKGVYLEPPAVAMQDREAIRLSFSRLLRRLLAGEGFVAIATHDEELIVDALHAVRRAGVPSERYEFQMLLGVRGDLARLLAREHAVRIYVPFGSDSYAYAQRRLRENPQIAGYVARDLLRGLTRRLRATR